MKENLPIKFNDLYEIVGETDQAEVSRIAGMETDENKKFDQNRYFFDCLNTVRRETINKKIERLTALFSAETDTEKRRELATEMSKLIKERSKIM